MQQTKFYKIVGNEVRVCPQKITLINPTLKQQIACGYRRYLPDYTPVPEYDEDTQHLETSYIYQNIEYEGNMEECIIHQYTVVDN